MFELDPKLVAAKVVVSWIPDSDFLPDNVTFLNPQCTIALYKHSKIQDSDPSAMLSGVCQLSQDSKSLQQLIIGGIAGATYVLEFLADFSDNVQRDGAQATIEVE